MRLIAMLAYPVAKYTLYAFIAFVGYLALIDIGWGARSIEAAPALAVMSILMLFR